MTILIKLKSLLKIDTQPVTPHIATVKSQFVEMISSLEEVATYHTSESDAKQQQIQNLQADIEAHKAEVDESLTFSKNLRSLLGEK